MEADENWTRVWEVDRLAALHRNPHTLFAYWEVSSRRRNLISRHFSHPWETLSLFLRANDVTDLRFSGENAHWTRFLAVSHQTDCEYIRDLPPNRRYVVDFGLLLASGQFFAVLRSPPVATPPLFAPEVKSAVQFFRLGQVVPKGSGGAADVREEPSQSAGSIPHAEQFDGYSAIERRVP